MSDAPALRRLTLIIGTAATIVIALLVVLVVSMMRRMERLEEHIAKPTATATASSATAPARAQSWQRSMEELHAPAQPKVPASRDFVQENGIDEIQWRTITRLNGYWLDTLKKAETEGESKLPDKLDAVAQQREIKLKAILGSDEAVARYHAFEEKLKDNKTTYKTANGKTYDGVPFE